MGQNSGPSHTFDPFARKTQGYMRSRFAPSDDDRDLRLEDQANKLAAQRLARMTMPEDLKSFAERHGLGTFMEVVWMNGFQHGMEHALAELRDQNKKQEGQSQ